MSQTSLTESSSSEPPRQAFDNATTLRLNSPYLAAEQSQGNKQSFALQGRYVYKTTATSITPTYHISTRNTQTGNPWQLQICRLLPNDARRLSAASSSGAPEPFVKYDDDLTIYSGEKIHIPISLGTKPLLVVRGQKQGTVQGSVLMEKSSRSYKFFHMIPIRRAATQAEEERMRALMHKRGYRDSDDWKKKLLLTVQEGPNKESKELSWIDEDGTVAATEQGGKLEFMDEIDTKKRDFIVVCWACKNFVLST